jgi:N6-adenosine-specific RNA methylase IME4
MSAPWPFGPLQMHKYNQIMADPPWHFALRSVAGETKSSQAKYGSMTFEEIKALPVRDLASRDCILFLWCTWPLLLHGGSPAMRFSDADAARSRVGEVINAWGFRYVTGGVWRKVTKHGKIGFGTGYRARSACEPFLLAVTGNPDTSRAERNIFDGLRREHSRKPDDAFAWCERHLPAAWRVELFSRQSRPGWDSWGYEVGKFDPVVHQGAEGAIETAA